MIQATTTHKMRGMAHAQQSPIDLTDYLALEEAGQIRHEYVGGYVHAMVGGSMRHNRISGNLYAALSQRTAGSRCQTFFTDIKLHVQAVDNIYYPDVSMLFGAGLAGERHMASDATLLVEVLSPSTAGTDRRERLFAYRRRPGLKAYWIASQDEQRVESHSRSPDARWMISIMADPEARLIAAAVPGEPARMADLYVGTDVA